MASMTPPVTATDPYKAAQRLRIILQGLVKTGVSGTIERINQIISYCVSIRTYEDLTKDQITQMRMHLNAVEQAAKDRRTQPGLEALNNARMNLMRIESNTMHLGSYREYINKVAGRAKMLLEGTSDEQQHDDDGNEIEAPGTLKEAYQLSQCLPTVPLLPQNPAENTLRAIIALLRHHKWPEAEGLTQADTIEEVSNGKDEGEGEGLSETLATFAAQLGSPTVPVATVEAGADDSDDDDE